MFLCIKHVEPIKSVAVCMWSILYSGALKNCFKVADADFAFNSCKQDICLANDGPDGKADSAEMDKLVCQAVEQFAEDCQAAGVKDLDWRKDNFCRK